MYDEIYDIVFGGSSGRDDDQKDDTNDVILTTSTIGLGFIPLAISAINKYFSAKNSGNTREADRHQNTFDNTISEIETSQSLLKNHMKNTLDEITSNKDQLKHEKLLQEYQKMQNLQDRTKQAVGKTRVWARENQYEATVEELQSLRTDLEEIVAQSRPQTQITPWNTPYQSPGQTGPAWWGEGISQTRGATLWDKAQSAVYQNALKSLLPNATNSLRDAIGNFRSASSNPNAYVLNSLSEIKNLELKNTMLQLGIPENSRGVVYLPSSEIANEIMKSAELNEFIFNNYNQLKKGELKIDRIEFKPFKDPDLFLTLQNVTLYEPRIDANGDFSALIIDYYDFVQRNYPSTSSSPVSSVANYVNNWGYNMQQKGELENYFIIIYTHFNVDRK
ncbi:hypothetical protein tpqmel_0438 [Candidatus Gastranaerophilus sp. (ex Termes propinquus)]|nr:hypothetical protein tpqmel_0438 [Candidatus Gastranaerophilus sp. (ex Termes propinquus)]